jgi:hypothetical protein
VVKDTEYFYRVFATKRDLLNFDKGDLKFIAVFLLSSHKPPIVNACDSDWAEHKTLLDLYSIKVVELLEYKNKNWN